MKRAPFPMTILSMVLVSGSAWAETLYVGQDSVGDGTGSSHENRMSVGDHNGYHLSPGSTVFLCGTIENEVTVTSDGEEGSPIVYSGSCSGAPGVIDRGNQSVGVVGIRLRERAYVTIEDLEIMNAGEGVEGFNSISNLTVRRCRIHDMAFRGVFVSSNTGNSNSNIVVGGAPGDGCEIFDVGWGTGGGDVSLNYGSNYVVSYNHLYGTEERAQGLESDRGIDGVITHYAENVLIEFNEIHGHNDNFGGNYDHHGLNGRGEDGIDLKKSTNNVVIRFNHIYDHQIQSGITVQMNSHNVSIYGNLIHDNDWCGVCMWDGSYNDSAHGDGQSVRDVRVWANVIHNHDGSGVYVARSSSHPDTGQPSDPVLNAFIFNNVIATSGLDPELAHITGIAIRSGEGHVISNNVLFNNHGQRNETRQVYLSDSFDNGEVILNGNHYYSPGNVATIYWGDQGDLSLVELQALGHEANGFEGDPGFLDANAHDYRLTEDSPCIDSGLDLGLEFVEALHPNQTDFFAFPPTVVVADQDAHGSGWEMGAFVYPGEIALCADLGGVCCGVGESCTGASEVSSDCMSCCLDGSCVIEEAYLYDATVVEAPPTIDGNLIEWIAVPSFEVTCSTTGAVGTYRLQWDEDALYIAVEADDSAPFASIEERDGELWVDDSLEIMFDTAHDRGSEILPGEDDYKFFVNLLNTQRDARGGGHWESWNTTFDSSVVSTDGEGYAIEVRIPWSEWGVARPDAGQMWGMDVVLNDQTATGGCDQAWANTNGDDRNDPDGWGVLRFVGDDVEHPECPSGLADCNGDVDDECETDLSIDPDHCGICNNACDDGWACNDSICAVECSSGLSDCNGSCVDLHTSIDHCGGCSNECIDGEQCVSGRCEPDGLPGGCGCATVKDRSSTSGLVVFFCFLGLGLKAFCRRYPFAPLG